MSKNLHRQKFLRQNFTPKTREFQHTPNRNKTSLIITAGNSTKGNRTLGNCMDNITLGNLTLGKYTLVTSTLGNLALSLGNHTPRTHVLRQKLRMFSLEIYPTSKYFTLTATAATVTFCMSV